MPKRIAKIAVSAATYWIDKPYDYLVPEELYDKALVGCRVYVPFSRGNRVSEGIILSIGDESDYDKLKPVFSVLDDRPILNDEQIKLALFMRKRFFCTVYEAVKAMLPVGLWYNEQGKRRVSDKTVEMARLSVSPEDAQIYADEKRRRSPQQANILDLLSSFGALPVREILQFTGAGRQSLKAVCESGLAELYHREVYRRPEISKTEEKPFPDLNEEQLNAFNGIMELSEEGEAKAALLLGVTGSGKTSVYIHLIRRHLENGSSAILLVPEIALTPQMIQTFSSYFGDNIAIMHSSLSTGERYDEWKRVKEGKAKLVIGTRSAVFAPVDKLGIIIIDEEQEETYKSENNPRYHARDIAKFRCARSGATLLLGSATPDVVSRYNAERGKYSLFRLEHRFNEKELPQVSIVDMKKELRKGNGGNISFFLRDEIQKNIDRGEQSILFINRRGANKLISCGECGYTYKCIKCSVSLTYHSNKKRLICHYCGYSRRVEESCPDCGGVLRYIGAGTQLIEEELKELFPGKEVLRMDTDAVGPVGSHEQLFDRFRNEKIPIMVGTQMVTKGLNFENVTLVGVISADQSLYAGHYRAGERSFSLITQVIGRSGRGEKAGRAVIQTYTPDNETIHQAAKQDYEDFYSSELLLRRLQNAPPFAELFSITASGLEEEQVVNCCKFALRRLKELKPSGDVRLLGPTPLAVVKVNNRYRYRVNISCADDKEIRSLISRVIIECSTDKRFRGVTVFADNDPTD